MSDICRNCEGKGHVLLGWTLISPLHIVLAPFERSDPAGLTRGKCTVCGGTGYRQKKEVER